MSKRAEYKNEVKTRLPDHVYEALAAFRALHGISSESLATARALELFLFGAVGTLPAQLIGVSAGAGQTGPRVRA
ncbi:hypothetical protein [Burkholderia cepacia]|uniref:hypothetical protein n=1 Tax=Burkholderia cepacia TaxID=292 RepID=UPI0009BFEFB0|nr:hypothetical protein [Burkholderia cepacia]